MIVTIILGVFSKRTTKISNFLIWSMVLFSVLASEGKQSFPGFGGFIYCKCLDEVACLLLEFN